MLLKFGICICIDAVLSKSFQSAIRNFQNNIGYIVAPMIACMITVTVSIKSKTDSGYYYYQTKIVFHTYTGPNAPTPSTNVSALRISYLHQLLNILFPCKFLLKIRKEKVRLIKRKKNERCWGPMYTEKENGKRIDRFVQLCPWWSQTFSIRINKR